MQVEHVQDRPAAAARPDCGAEILDEGRRRVRLPLSPGIVLAARRKRTRDHVHVLVDGLQRIVGLGQHAVVRGRRGVVAAGVELGHPEEIQVRLVADDDVPHLRDRARDRRRVGGEAGTVLVTERCRAAELVDGDDRTDACTVRRLCGASECVELRGRRRGERRRPDRAEDERLEAGTARELHLRLRVAVLGCVVHRAHDERGRLRDVPAAAGEQPRHEQSSDERAGQDPPSRIDPHPGIVGCSGARQTRHLEPSLLAMSLPLRQSHGRILSRPEGTVPPPEQAFWPKGTCPCL
jgi:hypothetical protein